MELGLLTVPAGARKYFPHRHVPLFGTRCMIKGTYQPFKENTVNHGGAGGFNIRRVVIVIKCVGDSGRIEDDILITKNGPV